MYTLWMRSPVGSEAGREYWWWEMERVQAVLRRLCFQTHP